MLLEYVFIMGICVEAITGALAAGRKKMDFFGVMLIACITSLGGGTVRDILFDTYPMTWVSHPEYLLYCTGCALVTIFFARPLGRLMKLFLVLDAVGLAAFVIIGTQKILSHGLSPSIAIISGMVTGICGGMLRDILCADIPLVLRKELYAVIALGGALLYIILEKLGYSETFTILVTMSAIFTTRLLAIIYHIQIPVFDYSEH